MKVWVTRDEAPGGPLSTALTAAGLETLLEPAVQRRPATGWDNRVVESLGDDDLLVLTSSYAIDLLASRTPFRAARVAVVGEASRRIAEAAGFHVTHVAAKGDVQSLFAELKRTRHQGRICYPRSAQAPEQSSWENVRVDCPVLYETVARNFDRGVMTRVDVVAVASPSAVRAVGRVALPFASIGPTTSKALGELGIDPVVEAPDRTFESLARSIVRYADESRHHRA